MAGCTVCAKVVSPVRSWRRQASAAPCLCNTPRPHAPKRPARSLRGPIWTNCPKKCLLMTTRRSAAKILKKRS